MDTDDLQTSPTSPWMEMERDPVLQIDYFWVLFTPTLFLISSVLPTIIARVCKNLGAQSQRERDIEGEIKSIKEEMVKLSMVDDFAKYSKLKRKLIQLNLSLESDVGAREAVNQKFTRILTYSSYLVLGLLYILTLFYSGHTQPVCVVPLNWFYPLNYVFSYPTGISGAISIPIWTILTRSTMSALIKI